MTDQSEKPKNKGGRPRKPVDTGSPEFQAAVTAGVETALERLLPALTAKLAGARGDVGQSVAPRDGDNDLLNRLAISLAEIGNQGSGRKVVAPEEMAKRKAARERLTDLLIRNHAAGIAHEYRLIAKTYLEEQFIEPFATDPKTKEIRPVDIIWPGVPNEAMQPLNDAAKAVFAEYTTSIGGVAQRVQGADSRDLWVTQRGLVIQGNGSAQRRTVGALGDSNRPEPEQVGRANDPTAKHVRILGTVMAPAKQNHANEQAR